MADENDRTDRTSGALVEVEGSSWYRIDHLELMEPFLTALVSDDDLWAFVSSAGPLTAGRVDADHAVLPYETDDRLHRMAGITGPVTVLVRHIGEDRQTWRPYGTDLDPACTRTMLREVTGTAMTLVETHGDWGLELRATWAASRDHGWVRRVELVDVRTADDNGTASDADLELEVVDGLVSVVPAGVDSSTMQVRSNLVDAYRRSETGPWGTAAIFALESLIIDRAEPGEALAATLVWSSGLPEATVHLDERIVEDVVAGRDRQPVELLTGRRGCFLLHDTVTVPAGGSATWTTVVDGGLGHAELRRRIRLAGDPDVLDEVQDEIAAGAARLQALIDEADGRQETADPVADAHHRSNVLFNAMRGGVFPYEHEVPTADLLGFLAARDRRVAERNRDLLDSLPSTIDIEQLRAVVEDRADPDLVRNVLAYLPLTFSRRHGDPSRPWNRFSIRVRDDDGDELLTYEGNWRDIFQNWEALLRSYPAWYPHVVATFVNASTVDGHNPYRISRDGIDWEVPDPDDPWSNIGYWGDHQIVYLHRLLTGWREVDPAGLDQWLHQRLFTYADVPYVIARHEQMLVDPRSTIDFDEERQAAVERRVTDIGADGRLVVDDDGHPVRVTFLEKLLVPALAKLSALVPGGGIWMNTQRPEWNDANNVLAGYGLSMVTLQQLAQYLVALRDLLDEAPEGPLSVSAPVATWLREVADALHGWDPVPARDDDTARRALLDALATTATDHRDATRGGFDATQTEIDHDEIDRLLDGALAHLDAAVDGSRRHDGLFESYNLVDFPTDDTATVEHLQLMLEGQVAAVSSPQLPLEEIGPVVASVFSSDLYRPDIDTLLLYPATPPPPFLDRNTLDAQRVAQLRLPDGLVGQRPASILQQGPEGTLHFRGDLSNAEHLAAALDEIEVDDDVRDRLLALYEETFDHHSFTGRSTAMHGYEGLGSVYWHMVSKLLVAVLERHTEAVRTDAPPEVVEAIAAAYRRIRDGLGFRMDPATFGAIPTDCYSHTPAHAGAQQPGMTGQVKEHVLARLGELGLGVVDGRLCVARSPLPTEQLVTTTATGEQGWSATVCGTPVTVRLGAEPRVEVVDADGAVSRHDGSVLPPAASAALFSRSGAIQQVTFTTT